MKMRLIDADKLLHQGYDYVVDGIAYDSCNKSMDIEDIPPVQAIPLAKVKQAINKVSNLRLESGIKGNVIDDEIYIDSMDVLNILDKLIENEGINDL